jgi:NAD(P)-dependent dehydrogenase (short-subunit alcohol dehydrogenase family)
MQAVEMYADLKGRVAFVTGASSGLGRHFATTLARAGMRVAIGARRLEALEELAVALRAEGADVRAMHLDVSDAQSVRTAIAEARAALGPIDVLVNNSGTTIAKPALEHSEADWDRVVDTNLRGAFLVATETARQMRDEAVAGSIINIASILGLRQAGQVVAYAASKAGLVQMTKVLALELARFSIRVNAIAPGYIETDLNRAFWATAAGQALIKRIPQRRLGRMADLDGILLLLASTVSAYMTGTVIPVDGGHLTSTL